MLGLHANHAGPRTPPHPEPKRQQTASSVPVNNFQGASKTAAWRPKQPPQFPEPAPRNRVKRDTLSCPLFGDLQDIPQNPGVGGQSVEYMVPSHGSAGAESLNPNYAVRECLFPGSQPLSYWGWEHCPGFKIVVSAYLVTQILGQGLQTNPN